MEHPALVNAITLTLEICLHSQPLKQPGVRNMIKQLCHGTYTATQFGGLVTIFAVGSHPTTGYKVYFQPYRVPNTYALIHKRPQGIVAEHITPFAVSTSYFSARKVDSVLVIDALGKHQVPVVAVTDAEMQSDHGGGNSPGPFVLPPVDGEAGQDQGSQTAPITCATGVGRSSTFSFEEALDNAIADGRKNLPVFPNPDIPLNVEVTSVAAEIGGFAGLHLLVVEVIVSF
jgi:hypothetical protein